MTARMDFVAYADRTVLLNQLHDTYREFPDRDHPAHAARRAAADRTAIRRGLTVDHINDLRRLHGQHLIGGAA